MPLKRDRAAGFTTTELIVMISIAGILAAVAAARFVDTGSFSSRGFYDRAAAVIRQAQKVAIAQRRTVFVSVTADRIAACYDAGCTPTALVRVSSAFGFTAGMDSELSKCSGDQTWLCAGAPSGVTLSAAAFNFDALGRASAATTISFTSTLPGDPPRQVVVEAETGYVHR